MIPALIILGVLIAVGIVVYIFELRWRRNHHEELNIKRDETDDEASGSGQERPAESSDGECCGLHLVCEKDSLSPMSADIIYYDDEELDRFVGRAAESYTPEEEEEFREVLMTLQPDDIAGWARSITQRHLELPPDVRDALLMLVREQRDSEVKSH
ncbi:MAG: phospholipase [Muribaculaceae bacterium]|nr:phospholipase [Muribaculaceae bacterium]